MELQRELRRANLALVIAAFALFGNIAIATHLRQIEKRFDTLTPQTRAVELLDKVHNHIETRAARTDSVVRAHARVDTVYRPGP